jgi:hypothetical protein
MRSLDPTEDFAIQLVRRFLVLCEHPRTRDRMLRIVERSPRAGEDAPRILRWLNRALLLPRMRRGTRPMSTMKWELIVSQLLALATMRYLVKLEPIASATRDDVIAMAAPGVLAVLQGADDVFTALVVDDEEDLSDLGDLTDLPEIEPALPGELGPVRARWRWARL